MNTVCLHSKKRVETFLRRQPYLHLYEIGDLDDFFWLHTIWYGYVQGEEIRQVVLLYAASSPPTLLAFTDYSTTETGDFLASLLPLLPRRFHAHLSPGLSEVFGNDYRIEAHGKFLKMALVDPSCLDTVNTTGVMQLGTSDATDLEALYEASYPGNWFDPRMLETRMYYGIRRGGQLASVAGVHVYSERYRVAALGNIATHPDYCGRGLATASCAKLCRSLLDSVEHIGLNVKATNTGAIHVYETLGFECIASYEEYFVDSQ